MVFAIIVKRVQVGQSLSENIGPIKTPKGHDQDHAQGQNHMIMEGQGRLDTPGQGLMNVTHIDHRIARHTNMAEQSLVHTLVLAHGPEEGTDQILTTEVGLVREKTIRLGILGTQAQEKTILKKMIETEGRGH